MVLNLLVIIYVWSIQKESRHGEVQNKANNRCLPIHSTNSSSNPAPRIIQYDVGSPIRKPNEIHDESLLPPPSKLFITISGQQIVSYISSHVNKSIDEGKQIASCSDNPMNSLKKFEGWSKEQLKKALEENIQIQALKDNLNSIMCISPLFW